MPAAFTMSNLNTSYVIVYPFVDLVKAHNYDNLNTSYVIVYQQSIKRRQNLKAI